MYIIDSKGFITNISKNDYNNDIEYFNKLWYKQYKISCDLGNKNENNSFIDNIITTRQINTSNNMFKKKYNYNVNDLIYEFNSQENQK